MEVEDNGRTNGNDEVDALLQFEETPTFQHGEITESNSGLDLVHEVIRSYSLEALSPPLSPLPPEHKLRHTLPPPAAPESIRNDIFFTEAAFDKYSVTKAPARKRQRLDSKSDHQAVEEPTKDKKQKTKKSIKDVKEPEPIPIEKTLSPPQEIPLFALKSKKVTPSKSAPNIELVSDVKKATQAVSPTDKKPTERKLPSIFIEKHKEKRPLEQSTKPAEQPVKPETPKEDEKPTETSSVAKKQKPSNPLIEILQQKQQHQNEMLQYQQQQLQEVLHQQYQQLSNRFSSLSEEEHALFLELQPKFLKEQQRQALAAPSSTPSLSPTELATFLLLRAKVSKEQEDYRRFQALEGTVNKDKYFVIRPEVEKQLEVKQVTALKRERLIKYPRYYDIHSAFDLRVVKSNVNDPILTHKSTVLQQGKVLMFKRPTVNEIPVTHNYMLKKRITKIEKIASVIPLSEDPNIIALAQKHNVDIAICSTAMVELIDNHEPSFSEGWEIPVAIKTLPGTPGNSAPRKLVIVEKPLQKMRVTVREKNNVFYDKAFESLGLQSPSSQKPIDFDVQPHPEAHRVAQEESNLTYNIWQFGRIMKVVCIPVEIVANEVALASQRLAKATSFATISTEYYSILTIPYIKLLVRCKIHGFIPDPKSPQGYRFVGIKSKLEYQPNRGFEEVTIRETARWWIYTFLRPDAHLIIGRINIFDSAILEIEHKDMVGILPSGCLFKPENSSKILFVTLDKMLLLEEGNYLLSHKSGDHNVVILESVKPEDVTSKHYDLHESHKRAPIVDVETVPHIPVRWSGKTNQIPETFPINKAVKSTVTSLNLANEMCPNVLQFGSCNIQGCILVHQTEPEKRVKIRKNVLYCHAFATTGTCPNGAQCKYPHLVQAEVEKMPEKRQKKKKKHKKKKVVAKVPPATDAPAAVPELQYKLDQMVEVTTIETEESGERI